MLSMPFEVIVLDDGVAVVVAGARGLTASQAICSLSDSSQGSGWTEQDHRKWVTIIQELTPTQEIDLHRITLVGRTKGGRKVEVQCCFVFSPLISKRTRVAIVAMITIEIIVWFTFTKATPLKENNSIHPNAVFASPSFVVRATGTAPLCYCLHGRNWGFFVGKS